MRFSSVGWFDVGIDGNRCCAILLYVKCGCGVLSRFVECG